MKEIIMMFLVAIVGIAGGLISVEIKNGNLHWLTSIIAPLGMVAIWAELMRASNKNLLQVTAWSDVVYNGTWLLGMVIAGLPTTLQQKIGMILLVAGAVLVS